MSRHTTQAALLARDARNRALRTFVVGLAIDLAVAVSLLVVAATSTDQVDWRLLGVSVLRTVVQTSGAYVLRRFADSSALPTPLPPADPGEPDAPAPDVQPAGG